MTTLKHLFVSLGLDPAQRGCRFKEESGGLNIFSRYSQKGCEFECVLAQALEECQCIPWNYPRFNLSVAACDFLGASCFEKVKSNRNMLTTLGKKAFQVVVLSCR